MNLINGSARAIETISDVAVLSEGINNSYIYFVASGFLVVTKRFAGEVFEVANIGYGQFFGETSILSDTPTSAEIRSTSATKLVQVPASIIQKLVEQNKKFHRAIEQTSQRRSASTALAINRVFQRLPQKIRETILYNAQITQLPAGQVIYHEDSDDTDSMYILTSGNCEVFIQNPEDNKRIVLARLVAGDEFGEIPLFTGNNHIATVISKTPCTLLKVPNKLINNWMTRYSDFAVAMKHTIRQKLTHSRSVLEQYKSGELTQIQNDLTSFAKQLESDETNKPD